MADVLIGDTTLTVVDPNVLKALERSARRLDKLTNELGLAYSSMDEGRNQKAGEVYAARNEFLQNLSQLRASEGF